MRKPVTTELLETLICVLEADDPNMDGHSLHVCKLTMLLYEYLPLNQRWGIDPEYLTYASLFLDIGKHGVPGRLLHQGGKLGEEEWKAMKRHPEIAAQILEPIGDFRRCVDWIRYHHERIDGTGYYHLKGDEIPLPARMIAVADTYSSITMERSYKPTMAHEDALSELRHVAGKQLDANLVEVFCGIPEHRILACDAEVREKIERYQKLIEQPMNNSV
ncbi:MAG: HD domain-containing protein [Butyrivibrio sp.]|nr:HD domain-containing protein [Butyrivibrio sp.]